MQQFLKILEAFADSGVPMVITPPPFSYQGARNGVPVAVKISREMDSWLDVFCGAMSMQMNTHVERPQGLLALAELGRLEYLRRAQAQSAIESELMQVMNGILSDMATQKP